MTSSATISCSRPRWCTTARSGRAASAGSFGNSVIASTVSTALALILGVPAAYALSRARFRGGRQIALWVLATRMAPPIAFTIPFFLAYRHLGLLDSVWGLPSST